MPLSVALIASGVLVPAAREKPSELSRMASDALAPHVDATISTARLATSDTASSDSLRGVSDARSRSISSTCWSRLSSCIRTSTNPTAGAPSETITSAGNASPVRGWTGTWRTNEPHSSSSARACSTSPVRLPRQEAHQHLADELFGRGSQECARCVVGVDDHAAEIGEEQGLRRETEQVPIWQQCRFRARNRAIRALAIPEQRGYTGLAVELRKADRLDVGAEPDRPSIAEPRLERAVPPAGLQDFHAERGTARAVAPDQRKEGRPGLAHRLASGNAEDLGRAIAPVNDLAGRIDYRESGPQSLEELKIWFARRRQASPVRGAVGPRAEVGVSCRLS